MSDQKGASQGPDAAADDTPRVGGVKLGPTLTGGLYLLLVGSAALALASREFPSVIPPGVGLAAPWVFLLFVVGFAVYRLAMVRAGKYSAPKAFFWIGAAVMFFMLLLPWARGRFDAAPVDALEQLLGDRNPKARAAAAELARFRSDGRRYGRALVRALGDPDPEVRSEAHRSLVALSGEDLGPAHDPAARAKWEARYP